jgi:hypothetical protein
MSLVLQPNLFNCAFLATPAPMDCGKSSLIRWTKVVILVSALATTGCAAREEAASRLFERKAKCREDGDKAQAGWKSWYAGGGQNWNKADEYAYNPTLNTCLWSGEYYSPDAKTHVKLVLDVYANRILVQFEEIGGKQLGEPSEAEFERRKAELIGSTTKQTGRSPK